MSTAITSIQFDLPLPEAPNTDPLLGAIDTRLAVIEHLALPSARTTVAFLHSVWECDSRDAIPVFDDPEHPIYCRPEGADRFSTAVAVLWTLDCERTALSEVKDAIEMYDAGGSRVVFEIDDLESAPEEEDERVVQPESRHGRVAAARIPPVSWLRAYLAQLRRERRDACLIGDAGRVARLDAERDGVVAYARARADERRAFVRGRAPQEWDDGNSRRVA